MHHLAHVGEPLLPHDLWGAWSLDTPVLPLLVGTVVLYVHAVRRPAEGGGVPSVSSRARMAMFATGMLALLVALVSPLDALGGALFSAHMLQHLLLTLVAAPLLLLGRLHVATLSLVPIAPRRRIARVLARRVRRTPTLIAVAAVGSHIATLLAWHTPMLYDAAASDPALHAAEHVTLLGTALGFWAVVGAARSRPAPAAAAAAFVTSLVSVLLAATMTAANAPWYVSHLTSARPWGLTPLEDQQAAAAMMWTPGGLVYLGAATAVIYHWIRRDERRLAARREAALTEPRDAAHDAAAAHHLDSSRYSAPTTSRNTSTSI